MVSHSRRKEIFIVSLFSLVSGSRTYFVFVSRVENAMATSANNYLIDIDFTWKKEKHIARMDIASEPGIIGKKQTMPHIFPIDFTTSSLHIGTRKSLRMIKMIIS